MARDEEQDTAGVVAPPPLIYGAGLALGLLANRIRPVTVLPRGPGRAVGWVLTAAGLALGASAIREMVRAGTTPDVREPATALVVGGPYRYSRNPIYLAFALLYAGIAALANAVWAALLLPAVLGVVRRGVIDREERYLTRRFGEEYSRYRSQVRRWV